MFCLFSKNVYFFSKLRVFFGKSGASDKRMPEMNYQILILVFDFDFGSIDCGVVFLVGQLDRSERSAFAETELTGYIAFLKIHWRHVGYGARSLYYWLSRIRGRKLRIEQRFF